MSVHCGNKVHQADIATDGHHHETVAQVRLCFARPQGLKSIEEAEYDAYLDDADERHMESVREAEMAYERFLEDGGEMADVIWYENEQDRLREIYAF